MLEEFELSCRRDHNSIFGKKKMIQKMSEDKKELIIEIFLAACKKHIQYWSTPTDIERMSGLVHSILCSLDGVDGCCPYNISHIEKASRGIQLHEEWGKHGR